MRICQLAIMFTIADNIWEYEFWPGLVNRVTVGFEINTTLNGITCEEEFDIYQIDKSSGVTQFCQENGRCHHTRPKS